jgi:hypothetical protein
MPGGAAEQYAQRVVAHLARQRCHGGEQVSGPR